MSTPQFLTDEDFSDIILDRVTRAEPSVDFVSVRVVGLASNPDIQILRFAARSGSLVLSHDVNTMSAAAKQLIEAHEPMAGLFLVPQQSDFNRVADSILLIWGASDAEEWRDRVVFLPL